MSSTSNSIKSILDLPPSVFAPPITSFLDVKFVLTILPVVCKHFHHICRQYTPLESWSSSTNFLLRAMKEVGGSNPPHVVSLHRLFRGIKNIRLSMSVQTAFCDPSTISTTGQFLHHLPQLQHLDLSRNLLTKNIEFLRRWPPNLISLNLSGNRFGSDIHRMPPLPCSLTSLDLSQNSIGNSIANLPILPAGLKSLFLASNKIGSALTRLQPLPTSLTALDLSSNDIGRHILGLPEFPPELQALGLGGNQLGDYLDLFPPFPPTLVRLVMACNQLSATSLIQLPVLPSTLRFLDLSGNDPAVTMSLLLQLQPHLMVTARVTLPSSAHPLLSSNSESVLPKTTATPIEAAPTAQHLPTSALFPAASPLSEQASHLHVVQPQPLPSSAGHDSTPPQTSTPPQLPLPGPELICDLALGMHVGWAARRRRVIAAEINMAAAQVHALRSSADALRAEAESFAARADLLAAQASSLAAQSQYLAAQASLLAAEADLDLLSSADE